MAVKPNRSLSTQNVAKLYLCCYINFIIFLLDILNSILKKYRENNNKKLKVRHNFIVDILYLCLFQRPT